MTHHYVYLVVCKDNTFYTGYTTDVRKRLDQHNGESSIPGARYTRSRRPVFLQYVEKHPTKSAAMKREYEIKQLTHQEKQQLVQRLTTDELLAAI